MGYCMRQTDSSFKIKKEHLANALDAIRDLANVSKHGSKMSGASYFANGEKELYYAWTNLKTIANAKDIKEAMGEWRWHVYLDDEGDIDGIQFDGEKIGDDKVLFDAIAPFVESGSFIEMDGEDGAKWRWVFDKGTCVEKWPDINWN